MCTYLDVNFQEDAKYFYITFHCIRLTLLATTTEICMDRSDASICTSEAINYHLNRIELDVASYRIHEKSIQFLANSFRIVCVY